MEHFLLFHITSHRRSVAQWCLTPVFLSDLTDELIEDEELFPDDALSNHTDMVDNEPMINEAKRSFIRYQKYLREQRLDAEKSIKRIMSPSFLTCCSAFGLQADECSVSGWREFQVPIRSETRLQPAETFRVAREEEAA